MEHYKVDLDKKWDYENGFYLTCETGRIGKLLNHLEIYKKIMDVPGDILEFGVYKGTSLVRLMAFRDLLESTHSRKIIGFDAFGKFPDDLALESDKEFVTNFEGLTTDDPVTIGDDSNPRHARTNLPTTQTDGATVATICRIYYKKIGDSGAPTAIIDNFRLNFSKKHPILHINKIDDLLFWTDNYNQPRRINITA